METLACLEGRMEFTTEVFLCALLRHQFVTFLHLTVQKVWFVPAVFLFANEMRKRVKMELLEGYSCWCCNIDIDFLIVLYLHLQMWEACILCRFLWLAHELPV